MPEGALTPIVRWFATKNGVAAPGAQLFTWLSGTSTPQPVYNNADLDPSHAHTNPVVADSAGLFPVMYLAAVSYRMLMTDADGVTIMPAQDDVYNFTQSALAQTVTIDAETPYDWTFPPAAADGVLEMDSSGVVTITQAPTLTIPVVSTRINLTGGQIAFPATPVPSADANTMDDYEEGTWTVILGGADGTSGQTYTDQLGSYLKIGNTVWIAGDATLTDKGTITGQLQIQGLPFATQSGTSPTVVGSACAFADFDGTAIDASWIAGFFPPASTHVQIRYKETDASTSMGDTDTALLASATACGFMGMYRTDA